MSRTESPVLQLLLLPQWLSCSSSLCSIPMAHLQLCANVECRTPGVSRYHWCLDRCLPAMAGLTFFFFGGGTSQSHPGMNESTCDVVAGQRRREKDKVHQQDCDERLPEMDGSQGGKRTKPTSANRFGKIQIPGFAMTSVMT